MKNRIDAILRRPQAEYLESLLPERDPLLREMESFAREHGHPIADPEVALLMRILVRLKKPRRVVEVGTNIGYSVVVMGRECGAGSVIETIEIDPKILEIARRFVRRADLRCEVVYHQGAALEVLSRLEGPFDFAFIDCVKTEYGDYVDLLLPRLEEEAVMVFDNLLWGGQVAEGPRSKDQVDSTLALGELNARLVKDPALLSTILPLGDGLGISLVQKKAASPSGGR